MGRNASGTVTHGELDAVIVLVGELLQRYYLLLEGSSLMSVTPAIQESLPLPPMRATRCPITSTRCASSIVVAQA